jgi:hypothetical protein
LKTRKSLSVVVLATSLVTGCASQRVTKDLVSADFDDVAVRDAVACVFRFNAWRIVSFDIPKEELDRICVTVHVHDVGWREALLAITAQARLDTTFTPDGYIRISKPK